MPNECHWLKIFEIQKDRGVLQTRVIGQISDQLQMLVELGTYIVVSFCIVFSWEHVARITDFTFKPSVFLDWCATWARVTCTWAGASAARISSFLVHLHLEDGLKTLDALLRPTVQLIVSPYYAIKECSMLEYKIPVTIVIGTIILLIVFVWIADCCFRYRYGFSILTISRETIQKWLNGIY
jgi:hypothetical protein